MDSIFRQDFPTNENIWVKKLKFVPKGPNDNQSALVQVMVLSTNHYPSQWWPSLLTHIYALCFDELTHWGRVTYIYVNKLTIIGSDNGLAPGRRQTIIGTNDGILLIEPLGTNFSEILIGIQTFSFKKMRLKVSSAKRRPFCLGLNVLRNVKKEPDRTYRCDPIMAHRVKAKR